MAQESTSVIITEFMPHPDLTVDSEWVEVFNEGSEEVDLGGWFLDDREKSPSSSPLDISGLVSSPSDLILCSRCYLVLMLTMNIFNNKSVDCVRLLDRGHLVEIDKYCYEDTVFGNGYARQLSQEEYTPVWFLTDQLTPGYPNHTIDPSPSLPLPTDSPVVTPSLEVTPSESEELLTGIWLSEVSVCPKEGGERVTIYNSNPFPVELIDWGLDDGVDGSSFYSFHSPVLISMYGYIDIELVGRNIFNNDGDSVELIDKNKNVVDRFTYSTCSPNWTWIRLGQSYGASWGKSNNSEPMEDSVILSSEADETITLTPTVQVSNSSVLGTVASSIGKNNFQGVTSSPSFSPPFAPVALRSVSFDQAGGSVSSESSDTAPLSPSYSNNDKKSPVWFAIPGLFIVIAGVLLVIAFR